MSKPKAKRALTIETHKVGSRPRPWREALTLTKHLALIGMVGLFAAVQADRLGEVAAMHTASITTSVDNSQKIRFLRPRMTVEFTQGPLAGQSFTLRTQSATHLSAGDCVKVGVYPSTISSILGQTPFTPESSLVHPVPASSCGPSLKPKT